MKLFKNEAAKKEQNPCYKEIPQGVTPFLCTNTIQLPNIVKLHILLIIHYTNTTLYTIKTR